MDKDKSYTIEYARWDNVVITAQLIIASLVCVIEILNNTLLYVTRSQGYGPDTIVQKLLRYLILTTVFNFGMLILSKIIEKKVVDDILKRYLLMFFTTLICTDVAFSHYQFAVTLAIFVIPVVISILYEDGKLTIFTTIISTVGDLVAIYARAIDTEYNKDIGPEAVIALALPVSVMVFAMLITKTLRERRDAVKEAVIRAEKSNAAAEKMALSFKMLETLAGTIDAKDKYTNGHSMRVAIYATKLAEELGWDKERIEKLRYEALLHDIGKIGVPDAILNKPSKLTDMEFDLIKSHTVVGADILKNMVAVPNATEVARYHHERFDGKGYPSNVSGNAIPINARIVCIADSFDAMSSDRIYRKALKRDVIREELINGKGTQFDPELLDVFLNLLEGHKLDNVIAMVFEPVNNTEQKYVMDDIESVIRKVNEMENHKNTLYEFDKFYKYMRNIGLRYNRSIEVLSVEINKTGSETPFDIDEEISDILQIAIRKNIRAVDVYYKYSASKHMLILLDAGVDNIDIIQQRILFDFNSNILSEGYTLQFSLNESIDSKR
ncbi:MAG: HD-GYP domain-containing protein [Lachnospiraceae bacterium]|nr:HD-GYP domain-containing protein [Lachnospiraceae bacterium]